MFSKPGGVSKNAALSYDDIGKRDVRPSAGYVADDEVILVDERDTRGEGGTHAYHALRSHRRFFGHEVLVHSIQQHVGPDPHDEHSHAQGEHYND